jgi:hypothetical protein
MTDELDVLDLDAARKSRAAQREAKDQPQPIVFGGEVVAYLPVELPLNVIAPLREIDDTIAIVIRQALALAKNTDDARARWEASELVVDMLAATPDLPIKLVDVVTKIAVNLLTQEGLDAFMAVRPSIQDIAAFVKGVFRHYGVSLGEALPSSDSPTGDGGTSLSTSSPDSNSTPEASGPTQEPLAS